MFEHVKNDIISVEYFLLRLVRYYLIATAMLLFGLIPGIVGFVLVSDLTFIEATINSISLLGGVEPLYALTSNSGHIFTAIYSLFIETVFFLAVATLLAPVAHRFFHKMHVHTE